MPSSFNAEDVARGAIEMNGPIAWVRYLAWEWGKIVIPALAVGFIAGWIAKGIGHD